MKSPTKVLRTAFLCGLWLALFSSTHAAVINWTNTAGGNWNAATNWSPNVIPGAADTAVITNFGIYTVTNNADTTVGHLVLGGTSDDIQFQTLFIGTSRTLTVLDTGLVQSWGQLRIAGGTLAGNADVNVVRGMVTLESGTLGGGNRIVLNNPGPGSPGSLDWWGGTLGPQASVAVGTNGYVSVRLTGTKTLQGSVTNAGRIRWMDGSWTIGGSLVNTASGVMEVVHDLELSQATSGVRTFANAGRIMKMGSNGTNVFELPILNSGQIEIFAGALSFANKSVFGAGTIFSGDGLSLLKNGTVTFSGSLQVSNVLLCGATLDGTNLLSGDLKWISGNWAPTAAVTLNTNGTLGIFNAGYVYLDGVLTNAGTVRWAGADLILRGTIHNLPGGMFYANCGDTGDTVRGYAGYTPLFVNAGGVMRTSGGLNRVCTVAVPFINQGAVYTATGLETKFTGGGELRDGCVFESELDATNRLSGGTFTLGGSVQAWLSHKFILDGATLAGTGTLIGKMDWANGSLNSSSALTVATNSQLLISGSALRYLDGSLTNSGTTVWTSTGTLIVRGSIYNLPGAVFDFENDEAMNGYAGYTPVFDNGGLLLKSAGTNMSMVGIPFLNNGTVQALTGTISFTGGGELNDCTYAGPGRIQLTSDAYTLGGTLGGSNLVVSGGTLDGRGILTGQLGWTSGPLAAGAALTVRPTGRLEFAGSALKMLTGALTNAGVITWADSGGIVLRGSLVNLASGTFDVQNDEAINGYAGYFPFIVNEGLFAKSAGTNVTTVGIPFTNNGTVWADSGTIKFTGGGACGPGCAFTGVGQNVLASGTYTLNGLVSSENLVLSGATLTGVGTLNGSFDWTSGTISAGLSFNIPSGAVLSLQSSGIKNINGSITNAGTIFWTGTGDLIVRGVIHNSSGGVFDARNDEVINDYPGYSPFFINDGTFRKSAGTNVTRCDIAFTNNATIAVDSGTLRFTGAFLEGLSGLTPRQAFLLNGGILDPPHPLTIYGLLSGAGSVTKSVTNQTGTVSPGPVNGPLRILGHYRQSRNGTLTFDLGGTTAGVSHSRLDITGNAEFSGTVAARRVGDYLPNPGDVFRVLTYASAQGGFFCFHGFYLLGHDLRLEIQSGSTNLNLVAVGAPDPKSPPLYHLAERLSGGDAVLFMCWPNEFPGFMLQSSTNLSLNAWTDFSTNHWSPTYAWRPEEYFRLKKP